MSIVSVKWLHCGEYRRFTLDVPHNSTGLFVSLVEKCRNVIPEFKGQLAWMDKDDDLIVFSTDQELFEALNTIQQGETFRIFTVVRNDRGKFVKAPLGDSVPKEGLKKEKEADQKVHTGVVCDGCDKPVVGIRYKCMSCVDYDLCSTCDGKNIHKEHCMARITDPNFRYRSFAPDLMNLGGRSFRGGHPGREARQRLAKATARADAMGQAYHSAMMPLVNASASAQATAPKVIPGEQMLRQVGQSVAAALSALGIDVDIDVEDTNGKRDRVNSDEQKPDEPKVDVQKPEEPKADVQKKMEDMTEMMNGAAKKMENANKKVEEAAKNVAAVMMKTQADNGTSSPAEDRQDWTLIDTPQAVGGQPVPSVYPTAPLVHIIQGQQIDDALNYLLAMGFTNEEGWLKQLLSAKNGDVNAVLDALNPRRA